MTTLQIISRCLQHNDELSQHISHSLQQGDCLLLLAEGVYSRHLEPFADYPVFMLQADATLSGLANPPPQVQLIDYAAWVSLGVQHVRSISWH